MQYYICEIAGRQYKVEPGKTIIVNKLSADKTLSVDKILLAVDDNKVEVGQPYLKKTLEFEVEGHIKGPKVRVAYYKPKANHRRVIGARAEGTKIKLAEPKKETVKKETSQKKEEKE